MSVAAGRDWCSQGGEQRCSRCCAEKEPNNLEGWGGEWVLQRQDVCSDWQTSNSLQVDGEDDKKKSTEA